MLISRNYTHAVSVYELNSGGFCTWTLSNKTCCRLPQCSASEPSVRRRWVALRRATSTSSSHKTVPATPDSCTAIHSPSPPASCNQRLRHIERYWITDAAVRDGHGSGRPAGRVGSGENFRQIWRVGSGQNIWNAICEFRSFCGVSDRSCNEKC